jgi:hypothetical protein
MPDQATIGLDNPAFRGRLRQPERIYARAGTNANRLSFSRTTNISEIRATQPTLPKEPVFPRPRLTISVPEPAPVVRIVQPQPFAAPAQVRQRPSRVLARRAVRFPWRQRNAASTKNVRLPGKLQIGLVSMAAVVFVLGMTASLQTVKTNHDATAQVAALAQKANSSNTPVVPSITKPAPSVLSQYVVAPNLPRYLKIPKLGVDARVLQVGVTTSGALGTPSNVFDTAWYTGSAEPGQPGATLIDGHVSSWTSHGVFYGLTTLLPGDQIQIVRGDGTVINYQVVKTQIYNASNVNMQAAITPITPGTSGLNLITCTGDVIPGTSLFNERIIVFAQEV